MIRDKRPASTRLTIAFVVGCIPQVLYASPGTKTVTYYYTDPQGNVLAETDEQGNIIKQADYHPYGAPALSSDLADGPSYTGHVSDSDTGLIYMQARYYDPNVARFVSTDPEPPTPGDLFNFSRFGYANGNPIINTDPTGENSVIIYNVDGSININIPINFSGPGATAQNITSIRSDVTSRWSGLYSVNNDITKVTVAVTSVDASTPRAAINNITLVNGPTSNTAASGASYVRSGNSGEWNVTSPGMNSGEAAHEAGHLMGDTDYYKNGADPNGNRVTQPLNGYANNLMGALGRNIISDNRNMSVILNSSKNVVQKPLPPPPPPPEKQTH